jgi:hypothetical protein
MSARYYQFILFIILTQAACSNQVSRNKKFDFPKNPGAKLPVLPVPSNNPVAAPALVGTPFVLPNPPAVCNVSQAHYLLPPPHPSFNADFSRARDAGPILGENYFSLSPTGSEFLGPVPVAGKDKPEFLPFHDFQLSLIPNGIESFPQLGSVAGLPLIGKYDADGYHLLSRLALIRLRPSSLTQILPASLKQALPAQLAAGTTPENLMTQLQAIDTRFYMVAMGTVMPPPPGQEVPAGNWFNIMYHPWGALEQWHNPNQRPDDFAQGPQMGIFQVSGIYSVDDFSHPGAHDYLNINSFRSSVVNYHHPYYSPNNAKFGVNPACALSSFWAAAVSEDLQHVNITYFLLANNIESERALADQIHESRRLSNLSQNLIRDTAVNNSILKDWASAIYHAATN